MRIRFAVTHFLISAAVVGTFVAFVLFVLYPSPLSWLEGVTLVLLLVIAVDLCLGPMLTAIVSSPAKPRRELIRDLTAIGLVQLAALGYGAYSVYVARPAFVVFNADRFDIVTPSELVWRDGGAATDKSLQALPVIRPVWTQAIAPASIKERNELVMESALGGPDLKNLPHLFHPFPTDKDAIRERAKPISELISLGADQKAAVLSAIGSAGEKPEDVLYVPLLGRQSTGVVLLRRSDLSVVQALAIAPVY